VRLVEANKVPACGAARTGTWAAPESIGWAIPAMSRGLKQRTGIRVLESWRILLLEPKVVCAVVRRRGDSMDWFRDIDEAACEILRFSIYAPPRRQYGPSRRAGSVAELGDWRHSAYWRCKSVPEVICSWPHQTGRCFFFFFCFFCGPPDQIVSISCLPGP